MKHVMVFGGSGHIGAALRRHLDPVAYRITNVSRKPQRPQDLAWDGKSLGDWARHLDSTDIVINLAGRRVHCRYNKANLQEMMDSRLDSTRSSARPSPPVTLRLACGCRAAPRPSTRTPSDLQMTT